VEHVREAIERGFRFAGKVFDLAQELFGLIVVATRFRAPVSQRHFRGVAIEFVSFVESPRRGEQREDNARKGSVNAGFVGGEPEEESKHHIHVVGADVVTADGKNGGDDDARPGQRHQRDGFGVEDGDDEDAAEVINDGGGQQEHAKPEGHAVANEREDTDREGDVGGDRDAPAAAWFA
jgi:hypothetical protein